MVAENSQTKFTRIYGDYSRLLLNYALKRTPSADIAADIVADTFAIAWQKIDLVPDNQEAKYWLYSVARRVLANAYRKDKTATKLGKELSDALYVANHGEFDAVSDTKVTIRRALTVLSAQDREIVTLSIWEGLGSEEIGKVLSMKPATVRSKLKRARERLKTELEKNPKSLQRNNDSTHLPR